MKLKFFISDKFKKRIVLFVALSLLVFCIIHFLPKPRFESPTGTLVYSREGTLMGARIADDGQWRFQASGTVNDKYTKALIIFEDRWFYWHPGVNPVSILRAFKQNVTSGRVVSGGSTLTMQTARMLERAPRTVTQKLKEFFVAIYLELRYSKDEILELYAANAPFGSNVVGIEAASWRWFGHSSSSLSWGESALLAVLPNSPSLMHPGKNRNLLRNKRNRLLERMYKKRIITKSDYLTAIDEEIPETPKDLPTLAPYLIAQIHKDQKGQIIQTTLSDRIQKRSEERLQSWHNEFKSNGINHLAALIIDVDRNEVLAYCGNVGFYSNGSGNQVDVLRAPRSTGSVLKPFLYCAGIQEAEILPHTLIPDVPININGFSPKNYSRDFDGAVKASEALQRSLNIPFVIRLREYGIPKFRDLLQQMGLKDINKSASHYGLSLILGGAESSIWDVASSYAALSRTLNNYCIDERYHVSDWEKPTYLQIHKPSKEQDQKNPILFDAGAIWQTFEVLSEVNRPEEMDWSLMPSIRKVAWKTGTSFGNRDAWAVGVTPQYVVAVWVGNADGEGRSGLTGASTAAPVMFDLFNFLPSTSWFDIPYGALQAAVVCPESGNLKGRYCENADTILVCKKAADFPVCTYHQMIAVTEDETERISIDSEGSANTKTVPWFVLPPSWEWFYARKHPDYKSLPPLQNSGSAYLRDNPIAFIYPSGTGAVILPRQMDGSKGKVILEATHRNSDMTLFWHLDEEFIGTTKTFHQKEVSSESGKHRILLLDEQGNTLSRTIEFK
ncbi:MAG: penicillin-binding protein 1C [Bacteroidales bacterium]